jgi:hypothetical protein
VPGWKLAKDAALYIVFLPFLVLGAVFIFGAVIVKAVRPLVGVTQRPARRLHDS